MNLTCNSTLEELRISPGSETLIAGPLNFHDLARVIAASCTLIAVILSGYLVFRHAVNYTQPREQRYIIRILFMVPVYAVSSYLQLQWYWHAIYFQVISDCYEAFAIASFFALLCHYTAPDLHAQKAFFREMRPIKPWVWPVNWLAACCGRQRGPWRVPRSGLTFLNIVWIGIYQYCFVRVAMTISAVVAQYFKRYCESSKSPVFGHIWACPPVPVLLLLVVLTGDALQIIVINAAAVTVAMFCLVQFYVQLRERLAEYRLLTKIVAIKLVVFLSFWQASAISVGTSTLNIVHLNQYLAYPDIKVGIPALLLCVEMACFALFHLWAFPYAPYAAGAPPCFYPDPDPDRPLRPPRLNERRAPAADRHHGSAAALAHALVDALNLWDFVKAFGRGMRWLLCGVRRRNDDLAYKFNQPDAVDMTRLAEPDARPRKDAPPTPPPPPPSSTVAMLAAYRDDASDPPSSPPRLGSRPTQLGHLAANADETAGLVQHAQPYAHAR